MLQRNFEANVSWVGGDSKAKMWKRILVLECFVMDICFLENSKYLHGS